MAQPIDAKALAHQAKELARQVRNLVIAHPQPHHIARVMPSPQGSGIHRAGPERPPQ